MKETRNFSLSTGKPMRRVLHGSACDCQEQGDRSDVLCPLHLSEKSGKTSEVEREPSPPVPRPGHTFLPRGERGAFSPSAWHVLLSAWGIVSHLKMEKHLLVFFFNQLQTGGPQELAGLVSMSLRVRAARPEHHDLRILVSFLLPSDGRPQAHEFSSLALSFPLAGPQWQKQAGFPQTLPFPPAPPQLALSLLSGAAMLLGSGQQEVAEVKYPACRPHP